MPERDHKKYLLRRVEELRGIARKIRYEGRNGAPDWFVMLPWRCFFLELKDLGEGPGVMQAREAIAMKRYGVDVVWANSPETIEAELLKGTMNFK